MDQEHSSYTRLMQVLRELGIINSQAELARLLNISEQVVTNWKRRGIAKDALIDLGDKYPFRIKYILTGELPMLRHEVYKNNSPRHQMDMVMQEMPEYKQALAVRLVNSLNESENGTTD